MGRMDESDFSRSDVALQLKPPVFLPTGTQDASTTPGPACVQMQKNESATTELYLQTFHLTKRFFTKLSKAGSYAVKLGVDRAGLFHETDYAGKCRLSGFKSWLCWCASSRAWKVSFTRSNDVGSVFHADLDLAVFPRIGCCSRGVCKSPGPLSTWSGL